MRKAQLHTFKSLWAVTICSVIGFPLPTLSAEADAFKPIVIAQAKPPGGGSDTAGDIDIEQARRLFEEHERNLEKLRLEQQSLETETQALDTERANLQAKL